MSEFQNRTVRSLVVLAQTKRWSSHLGKKTFEVFCGSAGSIELDFYNLDKVTPNTPLAIHLPSSPSHIEADFATPKALSSLPTASINYRWKSRISSFPPKPLNHSPFHRDSSFPIPLHDTLQAYSWLTTSFLPNLFPNSSLPPIFIYGSHLGGTLATSLALTETRSGPRNLIAGLIVRDGVFDWTGVATSKNPKSLDSMPSSASSSSLPHLESHLWKDLETNKKDNWDIQTLHNLKSSLFSNPSSCFDSFASPILFFRTAGLSIPSSFLDHTQPPHSPSPSPSPSPSLSPSLSPSNPSPDDPEEEEIEISRQYHLRFPPSHSELRIPRTLLLTSSAEGELARQAQEMQRLMRRSVAVHEFKERRLWDEDLDVAMESEERVRLALVDGEGDEDEDLRQWMDGE